MKKNLICISIHSIVDIITNSSTEIFIVDMSKVTEIIQEIFKLMQETTYCSETTITPLSEYDYKDDYIIPEDLDVDNVYVIDIERYEMMIGIINKFFPVIQLTHKEDLEDY